MTPHHFIAKWNDADGGERANYPLFFNELCDLHGVIHVDGLAARFAGKRGPAKTLPGLLAAREAVARAQKNTRTEPGARLDAWISGGFGRASGLALYRQRIKLYPCRRH